MVRMGVYGCTPIFVNVHYYTIGECLLPIFGRTTTTQKNNFPLLYNKEMFVANFWISSLF